MDTLTGLVSSAKSVFQPKNENDLKSFENFVYANYISDVEKEQEKEQENVLEEELVDCDVARKQHKRNVRYSVAGSIANWESLQQSAATNLRSYSSMESLKTSSNTLSPSTSIAKIRSISPSIKSIQSSKSSSSVTTTINEQTSSLSKVKGVSSSRLKKFKRHFAELTTKDEKLINYYTCALVSDILLQGHLYITAQHLAFYSNIFGYVTKVVIPTTIVTKIFKEKVAKIIPSAICVVTPKERHVFSSFISREAAFRLMCNVCLLTPIGILLKAPIDLEFSEEQSIEDESSNSISGNESPAASVTDVNAPLVVNSKIKDSLVRYNVAGSSLSIVRGISEVTVKVPKSPKPLKPPRKPKTPSVPKYDMLSQPSAAFYVDIFKNAESLIETESEEQNDSNTVSLLPTSATGTVSSTTATTSLSFTLDSSPPIVLPTAQPTTQNTLSWLKFPTELQVIYLGLLLSIILAIFTGFLLYKISDIETKTSLYTTTTPVLNLDTLNVDEFFADEL